MKKFANDSHELQSRSSHKVSKWSVRSRDVHDTRNAKHLLDKLRNGLKWWSPTKTKTFEGQSKKFNFFFACALHSSDHESSRLPIFGFLLTNISIRDTPMATQLFHLDRKSDENIREDTWTRSNKEGLRKDLLTKIEKKMKKKRVIDEMRFIFWNWNLVWCYW